jgi:hypothetical protein
MREDDDKPVETKPIRLEMGEAWMMCSTCSAKLYSFDGDKDSMRPCPYMRHGQCDPR